jgi:hypothetical protein
MGEQSSYQRDRRFSADQPVPSEGRVQYQLETEEQILRSIAARAPIAQILNEICTAIDCQIGNMVSLISLVEDKGDGSAEMARNAERFGLYIFSSVGIFGTSGKSLGSLEMYCCVARDASDNELQLIQRAVCLAALAMEYEGGEAFHVSPRKTESVLEHRNPPDSPVLN